MFCVDAVLRAYAQTRFLFAMNVIRLGLVVGLISWCLSTFGLVGAVLVTLLATTAVRIISIGRIAHLLKAPLTRYSAVRPSCRHRALRDRRGRVRPTG